MSLSVAALSFGGASIAEPSLRFHILLIEPDVQISRIRLSDKTSRLRTRLAASKFSQAYETEVFVEVQGGKGPALTSPGLVPIGCIHAKIRLNT